VFWQRADGAGAAERVTRPDTGTSHVPQSASRDGKWLLVTVNYGKTTDIDAFSFADRSLKSLGYVKDAPFTSADFSPDAAFVAYTAFEGTYVQPFPPAAAKYFVLRGIHPFWSRDGKELFASPGGGFASVPVTEAPTLKFGAVRGAARSWIEALGSGRNVDIMPDGQHLIAAVAPAAASAVPGHVDVVLNWTEELKARTSSK